MTLKSGLSLTAMMAALVTGGAMTFAWAGPSQAFVAGCSETSITDVTQIAHTPARCEPGFPAPVPLAARETIRLGSSTTSLEFMAVVMVGIDKGEFAAENLDIVLEIAPSPSGTQLTAQGQLDISLTAPDGAFYNAVAQGYNLKWVLGNFSARAGGGAGLWAQAGTTLDDLRDETIGTMVGPGSTVVYFIGKALEDAGGPTLADVHVTRFDASTLVQLLEGGGVKAVWLLDPAWVPLVDNPDFVKLAEQPLHQAFGGAIYGPNLLEDRREAGVAFARAYLRTINTYFRDDYKADPAFTAYLAGVLGQPVETLQTALSSVWDWEMRATTTDDLQAAMHTGGALTYEGIMPAADLIDRSFYLTAIGAE